MYSARGCASQTHTKLTPGWALIQINFDPMQEIGPRALFCERALFLRDYGMTIQIQPNGLPHVFISALHSWRRMRLSFVSLNLKCKYITIV